MVSQAYAPTCNAKEAEVERLYEELQDLLELTLITSLLLFLAPFPPLNPVLG